MKRKTHVRTHSFDYPSIIKYVALFAGFCLLNRMGKEVYPFSVSLFAAALLSGASPVVAPALLLGSFAACGAFGLMASAAVPAAFLTAVRLVYKKLKIKPSYEFVLFTAISLVGFIVIGDTEKVITIERRVITSIITAVLTLLSIVAIRAVSEKGLKFKLGFDEKAAVAALTVAFGLGVCNAFSPYVWKAVTVFCVLICCYLYRFGLGSFIAAVFGISLAVYYQNVEYISVSLIFGIAADTFMNVSGYVSAFAVVLADFVTELVFGVYGGYSVKEFLPCVIGAALFCVIPFKLLNALKEKLYSFREKQLVRQTINRNRLMLSNKLYELSGVFTEMSCAFTAFGKTQMTEDKAKEVFAEEIKNSVCKNCTGNARCVRCEKATDEGLYKMLDIGFAKGKLSLIDLPKEIGDHCLHPNDVIYGLNRLLADYRTYSLENENAVTSRQLLAAEASGVSEILRNLALESGSALKYRSKTERILGENLMRKGFNVSELLIYGDDDDVSVSMILTGTEFNLNLLESVVNKSLGQKTALTEKYNLTDDKFYLAFKKSADYDAVFGIARAVKDGSEVSGDTHSVIRISNEKFLVAVSDGMGSGKNAETVSSVSLSLIESFYRAGMDSSLILSTVNKLLSVNTEDSFTALDVSVIDLKNCSADFIKYGAPYGYIINSGAVRIVESSSLPLGILSDMTPSVCHAELSDGDMILIVTDGVTDAFGGSSEIIDFIRKEPALNPQTLSDRVLEEATALCGGEHKDDMTALSVRIFKKTESDCA